MMIMTMMMMIMTMMMMIMMNNDYGHDHKVIIEIAILVASDCYNVG